MRARVWVHMLGMTDSRPHTEGTAASGQVVAAWHIPSKHGSAQQEEMQGNHAMSHGQFWSLNTKPTRSLLCIDRQPYI